MLLADLGTEDAAFVEERTVEIKALVKRTTRNILEIGEKLVQVKERLGHGLFGKWLESEFEWSQDTANNFMRVAQHFADNPKISEFAPSALYLLAAPSTPDTARQEALKLAERGETVTHTKAKSIVERHKADDEDLAKFEAIASAPVEEAEQAEEVGETKRVKATVVASKPKLLLFSCQMEERQREAVYRILNITKERYSLRTTTEALLHVINWYSHGLEEG